MVERPTQVHLDVPFGEKDQAKAAGARWDPTAKRWYDPRPAATGQARPELQTWAALPEVPDLLPGEDREFGQGLFVDPVPESCWFTNVRTCVSPRDWERLRRMITCRAGQRCEICRRPEDRDQRRWLEAHERWAYDEHAGVQSLRRLICLCSDCHLSTHIGFANVTGRTDQAITHLQAVTGMTDHQADDHIAAAARHWAEQSGRLWALDLSILTDAGVTLAPPDEPATRAETARRYC
jgi:hypothetical protein